MINSTIERLRAMKMNALASELERQAENAENYKQLGFEDRLTLLVDAEWNRRQNNKLIRYIRNAHFSDANATIEGIEYIEDRHLDKGRMLRLSTCNYVDEGRHIILKGASGNGKTYIACALGNAALCTVLVLVPQQLKFNTGLLQFAVDVLKLSKKDYSEQLEVACEQALEHVIVPRYSHLKAILAVGQDVNFKWNKKQKNELSPAVFVCSAAYYEGNNHSECVCRCLKATCTVIQSQSAAT